jgi:hypothetical protein
VGQALDPQSLTEQVGLDGGSSFYKGYTLSKENSSFEAILPVTTGFAVLVDTKIMEGANFLEFLERGSPF